MKLNKLNNEEKAVIINKQTEMPFSGEYDNFYQKGIYVCKQCDNPLYSWKAKFDAGCGWPAFDDYFEGGVKVTKNSDGMGFEIACANCGGHLGHVYTGEYFTPKNMRHCVNSLSIKFIPEK